jgi:hypothetical protein
MGTSMDAFLKLSLLDYSCRCGRKGSNGRPLAILGLPGIVKLKAPFLAGLALMVLQG